MLFCVVCSEVSKSFRLYSFAPPSRKIGSSHGGGVRGELILRVEFALARLGDPSKHPKKRIERVGGAKKLRVVPLGRYLVLPRGKIMHSFVKEFKYQDRYCGRCVLTH